MHLRHLSFIFLSILFGCVDKTKTKESYNKIIDTIIQKPDLDIKDTEDTLFLDTIKFDQVLLNSLPLQIDTLTAIKTLGKPYSRNVYALGTCYRFGDATLWDFNGCRYYVYKDSLYFHELFFDAIYKEQKFKIQLPKLIISERTKIEEFQNTYKTSFTNSNQILSNTVIFRTGKPLNCQFKFEYKDGKLCRIAVGM
jgi:hypothetical protein